MVLMLHDQDLDFVLCWCPECCGCRLENDETCPVCDGHGRIYIAVTDDDDDDEIEGTDSG